MELISILVSVLFLGSAGFFIARAISIIKERKQ